MKTVRRTSITREKSHTGRTGRSTRSRSQERSMELNYHLEDRDGSIRASLRKLDRALSDPFDAPTDDVSSEADELEILHELQPEFVLPTLPRYPVGEQRDLNCWDEPDVSTFRVRGKDYLRNKKKTKSGPYLLKARGCDVFLADDPAHSVGDNNAILGGVLRKVPTFIIHLRFPWGHFIFYYEIPSLYLPFLAASGGKGSPSMKGMSAPERTLAKFFLGDDKHKNDRLKLVPHVAEGPWVARTMVTGKPAIIGNKLPVSYKYGPREGGKAEYLEADLDIGSSGKAAKKIVSVCRRYMNLLTADVGFVIEGKSADEMPEQMMGAIRIRGADPLKAPKLT